MKIRIDCYRGILSATTPSGTESYVYDAHGNLIETVYADGTKTTCKYEYYIL